MNHEFGIPGIQIVLDLNQDGRKSDNEPDVVTDQHGRYTIQGHAGTNHVLSMLPEPWLSTTSKQFHEYNLELIHVRTSDDMPQNGREKIVAAYSKDKDVVYTKVFDSYGRVLDTYAWSHFTQYGPSGDHKWLGKELRDLFLSNEDLASYSPSYYMMQRFKDLIPESESIEYLVQVNVGDGVTNLDFNVNHGRQIRFIRLLRVSSRGASRS